MGKDPLKFALVRDGLVILYSEILWKLIVRSYTWAGSSMWEQILNVIKSTDRLPARARH